MKSNLKFAIPVMAALSLSACKSKQGIEDNYYHRFSDADEVVNDCRTALKHASIFDESQRAVVCEKYLTGSPVEGGFVIQRRIPCEAVIRETKAEITELLADNEACFKPNINGWPENNLGPIVIR